MRDLPHSDDGVVGVGFYFCLLGRGGVIENGFGPAGMPGHTNLNYFVEITDKNIQGRYNIFVREEKKDNIDENRCENIFSGLTPQD